MKIIIAGGTGFIGKYISDRFRANGHDVIIISRQSNHIHWDETDRIIEALDHSGVLINLAGKSVNCRYNKKNKKAILESRIGSTRALGQAILKCSHPPALWINASTATIYRHAEDYAMTEDDGETGGGFSEEVAKRWEAAFFSFNFSATRQVALRITIVLGKGGGVLKPYRNLVYTGFGGRQGTGRQMFSWIHIEDLYRIILFVMQNGELEGVLNCVAPEPVANKDFMKKLRAAMHVPIGVPMPGWLLTLGAAIVGTEPELLLKSRWVAPKRLLKAGFSFSYNTVDNALKNLLL